jgi:hypothetical protein
MRPSKLIAIEVGGELFTLLFIYKKSGELKDVNLLFTTKEEVDSMGSSCLCGMVSFLCAPPIQIPLFSQQTGIQNRKYV